MELRFMGFDQNQNCRIYRFDALAKGEPTVRLEISADMALFLKHRIGLQEGPTLCATKLASDLAGASRADHELTNEDLLAYTMSRSAEAARKTKSRGIGLRRRNPVA